MVFEDNYKKPETPNDIILHARRKLSISGVEDVERFDEESVVLYTTEGLLVIRGSELHIDRLSLDGGELSVEGTIDSLAYEEGDGKRGSFWSRLFK